MIEMVRQWQELIHGSRYSESYFNFRFCKIIESFGIVGEAKKLNDLNPLIEDMLALKGPKQIYVLKRRKLLSYDTIRFSPLRYDIK